MEGSSCFLARPLDRIINFRQQAIPGHSLDHGFPFEILIQRDATKEVVMWSPSRRAACDKMSRVRVIMRRFDAVMSESRSSNMKVRRKRRLVGYGRVFDSGYSRREF